MRYVFVWILLVASTTAAKGIPDASSPYRAVYTAKFRMGTTDLPYEPGIVYRWVGTNLLLVSSKTGEELRQCRDWEDAAMLIGKEWVARLTPRIIVQLAEMMAVKLPKNLRDVSVNPSGKGLGVGFKANNLPGLDWTPDSLKFKFKGSSSKAAAMLEVRW